MNKLKVLELFGGIGACSKALERLGIDYEIADYVEIDKYAVKSFNAMHNTDFEPQDICKWDKDIQVDLVMHGSPCQDFSLAGKQAGGDEGSGTRSSLMYETIRIVEKLKPKYVIWENVKNVISKKHKHNYDNYCNRMSELGYISYGQVLNSKDYGIPQNRERVFTISIRKDLNQTFEFPQKQELKLKLKDMLEDKVDEKYYLSEKMINYILDNNDTQKGTKWEGRADNDTLNSNIAHTLSVRGAGDSQRARVSNFIVDNENKQIKVIDLKAKINIVGKTKSGGERSFILGTDGICNSLTATDYKQPKQILEENYLKIKNNTKKGYLEAKEGDDVDISSRMQHHRGTVQKEMIQTLDSQGGNSKGVVIKKDTPNYIEWEEEGKFESDCRAFKEDKISGAIVSTPKNKVLTIGNYMPSNHDASRVVDNEGLAPTVKENHGTVTATQDHLRIRKLTPKECWRLMGFDDEDFKKAEKVNSNTQLYKQAGNSIVVNVLVAIFKQLFNI